jgi:hypothetical protein
MSTTPRREFRGSFSYNLSTFTYLILTIYKSFTLRFMKQCQNVYNWQKKQSKDTKYTQVQLIFYNFLTFLYIDTVKEIKKETQKSNESSTQRHPHSSISSYRSSVSEPPLFSEPNMVSCSGLAGTGVAEVEPTKRGCSGELPVTEGGMTGLPIRLSPPETRPSGAPVADDAPG